MVLIIVGLVLLSLATAPVPLWYVSAALVICGVGFGFFLVPNNSRLLGAAPRNRQGIASGLLSCARTLGMVMGVAISGAVYTTVLHRVGPSGITHAVSMGLQVVAVLAAVAIVTTLLEPRGPATG